MAGYVDEKVAKVTLDIKVLPDFERVAAFRASTIALPN